MWPRLTNKLTYTGTTGTGTFTATAGVSGKTGTSGNVTINVGAAAKYIIAGSSTQTAGSTNNLTITIEDASGNTVPFTGDKILTFSGADSSTNPRTAPTVKDKTGAAVALGTPTTITFASGVATVSGNDNGVMTLYKAEGANVSVTDGSISSPTPLAVTVSHAGLEKFAWSLTSPQENALAFTGTNTLTAEDTYGNTVTSFDASTDSVSVTTSLSGAVSGLGSRFNHTLNQAADFTNGVATLTSKLTYTGTIGTGTFTATAGVSGKTGTSGSVTINAGAAAVVAVETKADGSGTVVPAQSIPSDSSMTVYAITRDGSNNFIANAAADSWSLLNKTGGVVDEDLVQSVDKKSAVFTGHVNGSAEIHATLGAFTANSGTITVTAGTATKYVIAGSSTQTAGSANNLTITFEDGSGNTVPYTGDKTLTFSGADSSTNPRTAPTVTDTAGTAVAFGVPTTIYFTNGVATVSGNKNGVMTLYKAGTDSIRVVNGTIFNSTPLVVAVSHANLEKFAWSLTSPQENALAFTGTNTLTAEDTYGNAVTSFDASTDSVSVTTSLSGAVSGLGSRYNHTLNQAADFTNGVATLTSKLTYTGTIGTGTFTATAGVSGKTGTSDNVTMNVGAAAKYIIAGSSTQTAGSTNNLTITIEDASGNTVPFTGDKTLTFSGADSSTNPRTAPTVKDKTGGAVAFGTPTTITFASGVANVSGNDNGVMTLYKAEGANVSVTDGSISSPTPLAVTVSHAGLEKFAWSLTSPQENALAFTGTNTLTAEDTYGNTVTSFDASTDSVSVTTSLSGAVSGLGSRSNHTLNQAADFTNGVATLTSKLTYTGTIGTGTFTATAGVSGKTGTSGSVTINAGAAAVVAVETKADGSGTVVPAQSIPSDSSMTVYAITRDGSNNFIANAAADSWSLVSKTGGVVDGDLVQSGDKKSAVFTGHVSGSAEIHATLGAFTANSGTITVTAGTATKYVIAGSSTQTAGSANNLTITFEDGSGNTVPYTGDKTLTFSGADSSTNPRTAPTVTDTAGTAVAFGVPTTIYFTNGVATVSGNKNGVMTLYKAGTDSIRVVNGTIFNSTPLVVAVSHANLEKFAWSLTSPQENALAFTGTNTLTAEDTYGNAVTSFDASTDSVSVTTSLSGAVSGLGSRFNHTLNQAADFTSGVATLTSKLTYTGTVGTGTFTATAGVSGKTGTSDNVTMNVGAAAKYIIAGSSTQTAGSTNNLTITLEDAQGTQFPSPETRH